MATLWQDLRFGIRLLIKDSWFTLMAILALGLGIGVNNTVFTFVNAVLVRGLPFEESHRIMYLDMRLLTRNQPRPVSYPDYVDWKSASKTFEDLGAFAGGTMNVSDAGHPPERLQGSFVTANAFRILRQRPLLGRDFRPEEDDKGAEPVVILGYGVWNTRYGKDPNILGRVVKVNDIASTIIGVMPEGMKFPTNADLWVPFIPNAEQEKRSTRLLGVFGRMRDEVTREQTQAEMSALAARLARQYPDSNKDLGAAVQTFNDRFNGGPIRLVFLTLMGAVGFVLLIACANVANLLLARSAQRAREVAVRVSLGATRRRVVRQLLLESLILGIISGALGLLLSFVGVSLFDRAVADVGKPYWITFTMDARVFSFLALVCIATSIIF
ncbi:MAG: ABC transporter permease, partial [Acidobacteria bacterium]|nr:ABC transporter permease [Acidobacteriota bacterium]